MRRESNATLSEGVVDLGGVPTMGIDKTNIEHDPPSQDLEMQDQTTPHLDSNTNSEVEASKEEIDPNLVDWDGPDDPENPRNWSTKLRWTNVYLISFTSLIMSLATSMFAPGIGLVLSDFHSSSEMLGSLVVSIYVLGIAFSPMLLAPLSEMFGRLYLYYCAYVLWLGFALGCAWSTSLPMLIVFRLLSGIAGAIPMTLGSGTIVDLVPQERRGGAMAMYILGPAVGPILGPVAGGFLAQAEGWRWIFWILSIAIGVMAILSGCFLRETYPVVLLERKAARLRQETGNPNLRSKLTRKETGKELWKNSIVRPTKILFLSPIVFSLCLYSAVCYGYLFILFTTFTMVFEEQYGFSAGISGLTYLGCGIGMMTGLMIMRATSDRLVKKLAAGGEMKPEYRLPIMMFGTPPMVIGFFWYGWSAEAHTHWIVPIIGTVFMGAGILLVFMPVQLYLVDAFGLYAASAAAAGTILRSIFGATLPLAGPDMYESLGVGWGNSLLAFVALAFSPLPVLFYKYGEQIRKRYPLNL